MIFLSNLRHEEKEVLRELRDKNKITIKSGDKGGAVVVMDTTDYIGECTRQLDNTSYNRKLTSDPTNRFNKKIKETIEKAKEDQKISSKTGKALSFLIPLREGRFYTFLKIHEEGNPESPIVDGIGCTTEIISQFVDFHNYEGSGQPATFISAG